MVSWLLPCCKQKDHTYTTTLQQQTTHNQRQETSSNHQWFHLWWFSTYRYVMVHLLTKIFSSATLQLGPPALATPKGGWVFVSKVKEWLLDWNLSTYNNCFTKQCQEWFPQINKHIPMFALQQKHPKKCHLRLGPANFIVPDLRQNQLRKGGKMWILKVLRVSQQNDAQHDHPL